MGNGAENDLVFKFGSSGETSCDFGYIRISDVKVCQQGAAHLGKKFQTRLLIEGHGIKRIYGKPQCMTSASPGRSESKVGMSNRLGGGARLVCMKESGGDDGKSGGKGGG